MPEQEQQQVDIDVAIILQVEAGPGDVGIKTLGLPRVGVDHEQRTELETAPGEQLLPLRGAAGRIAAFEAAKAA